MRILVACGTRPEIVKLAPVTHALVGHGHSVRVVFTGQHTDPRLADDFLSRSRARPRRGVEPAGRRGRRASARSSRLRTRSSPPIRADAVLLLGDTHTVPLFALAARRFGVPVVHVEAGLRSFNPRSLEESHRRTAAALASLHFAPTDLAAHFLDAEGVDPRRVIVVGNPVTDTLAAVGSPAGPRRRARRGAVHRAPGHQRRLPTTAWPRSRSRSRGLAHEVGPVTFPVHPRTDARLRATGARPCLVGDGRRHPHSSLAVQGDARGDRFGARRRHRFRRAPGGGVVVRRPRGGAAPVDAAVGRRPARHHRARRSRRDACGRRRALVQLARRADAESTRCPARTATGT